MLGVHGAVLGTNRDGHASLRAIRVGELASRVYPRTRGSVEPVEVQMLLLDRVLDACLLEVLKNRRQEFFGGYRHLICRLGRLERTVWREALYGERAGNP